MEYYVVIGALLVALVALYFKKPKHLYVLVAKVIIDNLRKREGDVVLAIYNKLPESFKATVDTKTLAEIVGVIFGFVIQVLEETAVEDLSK